MNRQSPEMMKLQVFLKKYHMTLEDHTIFNDRDNYHNSKISLTITTRVPTNRNCFIYETHK